jgi:kynurenine formamidase
MSGKNSAKVDLPACQNQLSSQPKNMEVIDLTHIIEENMPAYPGEESPHLENKYNYQRDGFQVIKLTMFTHSGTHLDTPAHFFDNGLTTDKLPLSDFYGKGVLVDCSGFSENEIIDVDYVKMYRAELAAADFALIFTGWSDHWGSDRYFGDFPVLSKEACSFLLSCNLKGIGLDVISIDSISSNDFENHNLVLSNGLIIIENLTNLESLINKSFDFAVFPLKIKDGDGSPVRAAAISK